MTNATKIRKNSKAFIASYILQSAIFISILLTVYEMSVTHISLKMRYIDMTSETKRRNWSGPWKFTDIIFFFPLKTWGRFWRGTKYFNVASTSTSNSHPCLCFLKKLFVSQYTHLDPLSSLYDFIFIFIYGNSFQSHSCIFKWIGWSVCYASEVSTRKVLNCHSTSSEHNYSSDIIIIALS